MNAHILVTASALSDQDLLARLDVLAGNEREASAELVGHLAALDGRPSLYAAEGYGSLFTYCTQALRLSEDAACNRIEAARASRRFPLILDLLASGSLTLTSIRLLGRHLTTENFESVLARAMNKRRREIEGLVAELAPRPDLPSTVRKVPCRKATPSLLGGPGVAPDLGHELALGVRHELAPGPGPAIGIGPELAPGLAPGPTSELAPGPASGPAPALGPGSRLTRLPSAASAVIAPSPSAPPATPRPIVQASAPERYRVQFTIGQEVHDKLRRLQALLRREIPDGDPGAIFDRALTVLLEKVEKTKLAAAVKPRSNKRIRPAADKDKEVRRPGRPSHHVPPAPPSRTVPSEVRREVWRRDAGQCAFLAPAGRRCSERTFLEFHHRQPYALQGPATVDNISLRCWRHNQYEAELIFGPHRPSIVRGVRPSP